MKIFVFDKNVVLTMALALLIAVSLVPLSMVASRSAAGKNAESLPLYSVETAEKKVAVTFNAAWGAEDIDSILETLQAFNAKCTFFIVGTWAEKYPEAVHKIKNAGHEIGSHSYNHGHYGEMTEAEMMQDMDKADAALQSITGETTRLFRAPYGEYTEEAVKTVRSRGQYMIQWNIDSLDYAGKSTAEMEARILPRLRPGSIILFHTGTEQTAAALPALLHKIKEEGYTFSTVGDLMYTEGYTINHEGRQIKD